MSSPVETYVLERIRAAQVIADPFAHCVIDDAFPPDFFEDIIDHWPDDAAFVPIPETGRTGAAYRERRVLILRDSDLGRLDDRRRAFWQTRVAAWLMRETFARAVAEKFPQELAQAHPDWRTRPLRGDALIVSDRTHYALGPHTDSPRRAASLLFYLPEDSAFQRFGTSLYVPHDPAFRSAGGPHYNVAGFIRVKTIEFVPNRLLMFPKTDRCFHGVEPVDLPDIERRLLLYDVQWVKDGAAAA